MTGEQRPDQSTLRDSAAWAALLERQKNRQPHQAIPASAYTITGVGALPLSSDEVNMVQPGMPGQISERVARMLRDGPRNRPPRRVGLSLEYEQATAAARVLVAQAYAARLAALPHEVLVDLAAQACEDNLAFRHAANACLAAERQKVLDGVLLSPDLVAQIFSSLEAQDHAVAPVCKMWAVEWKARERRILRPVPFPTLAAIDFERPDPVAFAALPGGDMGGERLAIATYARVHIVDKDMRLQYTLGGGGGGIKFSIVSPSPALDTFAVAAELMDEDERTYHRLTLAPGGLLFVLTTRYSYDGDDDDDDHDVPVASMRELLALDALSLEVRFTVGGDVLGGGTYDPGGLDELDELEGPNGLAVCGDEVYVSNGADRSIRVLSLSGKPRRVLSSQPGGWRVPKSLCCVADRLYVIEDEPGTATVSPPTRRRIFVLTPEGRTLCVYRSPTPLEEIGWFGMCWFDGKLLVADHYYPHRDLLALQPGGLSL